MWQVAWQIVEALGDIDQGAGAMELLVLKAGSEDAFEVAVAITLVPLV